MGFLQTEQPDVVIFSEHGLRKEDLFSINFQDYEVVGELSRVKHRLNVAVIGCFG